MCLRMNCLQKYSLEMLKNDPSILEKRKIITIEDLFENISDYDEIIKKTSQLHKLKSDFKFLRFYSTEFCVKTNTYIETEKNHYIKWNIDNTYLKKNKKENINKNINQLQISDEKIMYYPNKKSIYTLIIYGSEYGVDFQGGKFEFSNGVKIKPQKNMCILFDSIEAHCVHKLKSGTCQFILIKFF